MEPSTKLDEASPSSLDEFFARNPRELTDADLTIIVEELRRKRALWLNAEAEAKPKTKAKKPQLTLEDLGIDL